MYYTLYTSTPRQPITMEVLNEIVNISVVKNSSLNITGILLGIEKKFLQYLEGPEESVNDLIENIKADNRHYDVVQWVSGHTDERVFSEWSMASWLLPNEELQSLTALKDFRSFLRNPSNEEVQSKRFIIMMNTLLKTWIENNKD